MTLFNHPKSNLIYVAYVVLRLYTLVTTSKSLFADGSNEGVPLPSLRRSGFLLRSQPGPGELPTRGLRIPMREGSESSKINSMLDSLF